MTMLEWALKYAEQGYAVFPLMPKGKIPATAHGFKDATTDEAQIRSWWTQRPDANIGVATGHGLVVIDVDDKIDEGKLGGYELKKWEKEHGELPQTWTVITGTGGMHYWYRTQENFTNTTGIFGAIDVRSLGGYVVAPPSIHPNGNPYSWEASGDPDDIEIADLSGSALELLKTHGSRAKEHTKEGEYRESEKIPKGQRQSSLMSLQGRMLNMGLSAGSIMTVVRLENESRCDPPMTEEELQKEIFPFLYRGIIPEDDYAETVAPSNRLDVPVRKLPQPYSLASVYNDPPPLAPEIIEGVLRQGHKMLLSAPSKAGKSFALIRLAIAFAEGYNWFGNRCTQGKVMYINMEIDDASCINRFKKIYDLDLKLGEYAHPDNITIWGLRGYTEPLSVLTNDIIETAGHEHLAIIIDPLYKVMEGDENSNSDIAKMVANFDRIARETGAAVIYGHHFAKGAGGDKATIDRAAGAGTFARDPDAILTMTQLDQSDEENETHTAWRIEYTLREFPNKKPYNVWFEYPVHRFEESLEDEQVETSTTRKAKAQKKADEKEKQKRKKNVIAIVNEIMKPDGTFLVDDFFEKYRVFEDISEKTAKRRLEEAGYAAEKQKKVGEEVPWKAVKTPFMKS